MSVVMMLSREVKRVPLDFNWPLNEVWEGYLHPENLHERKCEACEGTGYSPHAKIFYDQWYGHVPFVPSEPLTHLTPEVREFATRNVEGNPDFYGTGEGAIDREARRLVRFWNGLWSHHLNQEDVDALIEAERLMDFTHTYTKEGWKPRNPMPVVTAAQVNSWAIGGFGHDSINCWIAVKAKCRRVGVPVNCSVCDGHGEIERWPGQRAAAEAWKPTQPPKGDAYQLWESVSEGSPVSPPFASEEDLALWLAGNYTGSVIGDRSVDEWLSIIRDEVFAQDIHTEELV